jgi:hypothetical protein
LFYRQLIAAVAEKPLELTGIYRKLSVHRAGYISDCIEKAPIARAVIAEVDGKIRALAKPRNFTFRPVLIHFNGVDDAVAEAGYFDAIIDFRELRQ